MSHIERLVRVAVECVKVIQSGVGSMMIYCFVRTFLGVRSIDCFIFLRCLSLRLLEICGIFVVDECSVKEQGNE